MPRQRTRLVAASGWLLLLAMLCSCRTSQLAFVRDQRVAITAPTDGATTSGTVTLRWTYRGAPLGLPRAPARFAVFADVAAIAPGQNLTALARLADGKPDTACLARPGCLDETYLAARGVYLTTTRHVSVQLPSVTHTTDRTLTVVLLDAGGRRIGEGAWSVDVRQRELDLSEGPAPWDATS